MEINNQNEVRNIQRAYKKQVSNEIKDKNQKINNLRKTNEHEIKVEKKKLDGKVLTEKKGQIERLNNIKKSYNDSITIIKNRFDQELERLKNSFLSSKTKLYGMDKDEFQDRIEIKTKIIESPKHVEVEVYVPKEQSSNLFTTVDQRDIKINLSRNYSDEYFVDNEKTNFRKNQSVTKIIPVNDILSERKISKVILEDKTIFKIPKA